MILRSPTGLVVASALVFGGALAAGIASFVPAALAQGVDIEAIFNCAADGPLGDQTPEVCAETRDLVLNNCTACHSFVPIVKAEKTDEEWDATLDVHRERVTAFSDEQWAQVETFLKAHFNDQIPAPVLPPALEALGAESPV